MEIEDHEDREEAKEVTEIEPEAESSIKLTQMKSDPSRIKVDKFKDKNVLIPETYVEVEMEDHLMMKVDKEEGVELVEFTIRNSHNPNERLFREDQTTHDLKELNKDKMMGTSKTNKDHIE